MSEQTSMFFSSFCTLEKCTPIQLKFSTLVGHPEVIISINFGENPDHLRKTRTIFIDTPTE